jgi:hypothetical protein
VPKLTVLVRKSYGQAYQHGGGRNSDEFIADGDRRSELMDPNYAVTVVHGLKPGDPGFSDKLAQMQKDNSVYDIASILRGAGRSGPTRRADYLLRMLDVHQLRKTNGVGRHLLSSWPTSF